MSKTVLLDELAEKDQEITSLEDQLKQTRGKYIMYCQRQAAFGVLIFAILLIALVVAITL